MSEQEETVEKKEVFQNGEGNEVLIGLDAVALYPSISPEVAKEACWQAALETEVKVQSMNYMDGTRFLALCMENDETEKAGLRGLLPRRRPGKDGKKTRRLKLTTENSLRPKVNDKSQWIWPSVNLSKLDKQKIFAMVVAWMVQIFCETQVYTWRGRFFR